MAARHPARLEIAATRGDSWLLIRSSSPQGKILFQGTLARGRSVRFQKGRLWIRVGAASNVDLRANGVRPRVTLYGTFDAIVTAAGLSKVPLAGGLPGP